MPTTVADVHKNLMLAATVTSLTTNGTVQILDGATVLCTMNITGVSAPSAGSITVSSDRVAATNATPVTATSVTFLSNGVVQLTAGVEATAVANSGNVTIANQVSSANEYQLNNLTVSIP